MIQEAGSLIDGRWQWNLMWCREMFQWEEDQYSELVEIIAPFFPLDINDKWLWLGDGIQGFTVKTTYLQLENMANNRRTLEPIEVFVFKRLWECASPSKIRAFVWQLLLNRVQTKDNLYKRKMLRIDQQTCVMCERKAETAVHLFL
ncbi:embryonic abundant protein, partial [Trifolium pratense]